MIAPDTPKQLSYERRRRWPAEQAQKWFAARPLPFGFNYVTSTAVNSTEMWLAETFDQDTITKELQWGGELGFNSCRVFLPFIVWDADSQGFLSRLDAFLTIASKAGLSTVPILFDDCAFAGKEPFLGPQDPPVLGKHNSGWTPSPGFQIADDMDMWPRLEQYVAAVTGQFGRDERILTWDLYNEPGNSQRGARSEPLLRAVFHWAEEHASQPLTTGAWGASVLDHLCIELSDVVSFHIYDSLEATENTIRQLQQHGRPLLCTEWMARTRDSRFITHLPLFGREQAGCFNWGLVNGKTQTHFPWGSSDPTIWFHDVFTQEGEPYDPEEIAAIRAFATEQEV